MRHYLEYNGIVLSAKDDEVAPANWAFYIQNTLESDGRQKIVIERAQSFDLVFGPYVVDQLKIRPLSIPDTEISRADVERYVIPSLERKTLEAGSKEEFYLPKK